MKLLIGLAVLMCQWNLISCDPGIIKDFQDLPDFRKTREKSLYSTKQPSHNSIGDFGKSTTPATVSNFHPIQLTQEDVVHGSNSVYGSQSQLSNGGILFAISQAQGSTSQPLVTAAQAQPVLMQYLSPQGTPQQAAVQYIQLLRPIMMVPAKPYQPEKPLGDLQTQNQSQLTSDASSPPPYSTTKPSAWNPYTPFNRQALVGSYSSQYTSYNPRPVIPQANHMSQINQQLAFDIGLNINEYMPSASSQVSSVVAPRSSLSSYSPYAYKPNKFQPIAQRA